MPADRASTAAADLHASTTAVTGALTASVLAGAVMAMPVGRWLDRHGGRVLMTAGSVAATALVAAWPRVHTVAQLYAVLIGIGICAAMVLYEPALAVVVSSFNPKRRGKAVLAVIVVAGFASTVFMPLTGLLADRYGWRIALLLLAVLYGAITIPLHAAAVRKPSRPASSRSLSRAGDSGPVARTRSWRRRSLLVSSMISRSPAGTVMVSGRKHISSAVTVMVVVCPFQVIPDVAAAGVGCAVAVGRRHAAADGELHDTATTATGRLGAAAASLPPGSAVAMTR